MNGEHEVGPDGRSVVEAAEAEGVADGGERLEDDLAQRARSVGQLARQLCREGITVAGGVLEALQRAKRLRDRGDRPAPRTVEGEVRLAGGQGGQRGLGVVAPGRDQHVVNEEGVAARALVPAPAEPRHSLEASGRVVESETGQANVRFRLAGTGLLEAFGFDLRGMSARAIMEGRSRESFVALIAESIAEPGVGYARLTAPDGVSAWEVVLLPLRGSFGTIDRVIGCLHPVSGRAPEPGHVPLRFTIESMSIQPVEAGEGPAETPEPVAGFAEEQTPFQPGERRGLRSIEGGGRKGERTERETPKLKIIRDKE